MRGKDEAAREERGDGKEAEKTARKGEEQTCEDGREIVRGMRMGWEVELHKGVASLSLRVEQKERE